MAKFQVNQKVRVVDKNSPQHGRVATVSVVTPQQNSVIYGLMFDLKENPKLPAVGRFVEEQLEATA